MMDPRITLMLNSPRPPGKDIPIRQIFQGRVTFESWARAMFAGQS